MTAAREDKRHRVWLVEINFSHTGGKWEPTVGVGLTRDAARQTMQQEWKYKNPTCRFRIRPYVRTA